jgi:uncharacterized protein
MSQENVELVRWAYEAFNRRDIAGLLGALHPDVELQTTVEAHRGPDGVAAWIREADGVFDGFAIRVDEVIDLGDRVVATVHEHGRGKDSGLEIDQDFTHVWTVQEGRVRKLQAFTERAAAVEAIGPQEQRARP